MAGDGYALKDDLFNRQTVTMAANALGSVYPKLDPVPFVDKVTRGFEPLALKERMSYLRQCIEEALVGDYRTIAKLLVEAAKDQEPHFVYGAFCDYIEVNGCREEDVAFSLDILGELTKAFSAEFAIRSFINKFPQESHEAMILWSQSEDVDQRRLASEGLRPKLPWAKAIHMDYKKAAEPLAYLYYDSERYVTRSVANHLNDISKIDPDFVLGRLATWEKSAKQDPKEMAYIINHSTRTLIKQGHSGALDLLGYKTDAMVKVVDFTIQSPSIRIGEALEFAFSLKAEEDVKLMIDYVIEYPMAKGKRSEKVFKIKKASLKAGEGLEVKKGHPFRVMTTKKLYSGTYKVTLQINGHRLNSGGFSLEVDQ